MAEIKEVLARLGNAVLYDTEVTVSSMAVRFIIDSFKKLEEQNENLKCCENCKYWHTCSFTCDITLCTGWEYDGLKSAEREG